jgi:hypothetical protein
LAVGNDNPALVLQNLRREPRRGGQVILPPHFWQTLCITIHNARKQGRESDCNYGRELPILLAAAAGDGTVLINNDAAAPVSADQIDSRPISPQLNSSQPQPKRQKRRIDYAGSSGNRLDKR